MQPTLGELRDLFWRATWTGISVFLSSFTAFASGAIPNGEEFQQDVQHAAIAAASAVLTNVVLVYVRQKAPNTGINANAPAQPMTRGENK